MNTLRLFLLALCLVPLAASAVEVPDAWIDRIEGGWSGVDNATPMGTMPFSMLFDREDDGALAAHSAFNQDTWIAMRFFREDGAWLLEEAAALEGQEQRRVLRAVAIDGDTIRFEDDTNLVMILTVDATRFEIDVDIDDYDHAHFRLDRLPDDHLAGMREEMAHRRTLTAAQTGTLADVMTASALGDVENEDPMTAAREAAAAAPDDAEAQMALARAAMKAIEADPASAVMVAGDLLRSLQKAHALDPDWPEPMHGLVGYYLQAPPIAGGSVDAAAAMVEKLSAVDPEGAAHWTPQLEARRAPASGDTR